VLVKHGERENQQGEGSDSPSSRQPRAQMPCPARGSLPEGEQRGQHAHACMYACVCVCVYVCMCVCVYACMCGHAPAGSSATILATQAAWLAGSPPMMGSSNRGTRGWYA
jgi:hypothetical protein